MAAKGASCLNILRAVSLASTLLKVQSMCLNALGFVEFTSEVHKLFSPVVLGLEPVALHMLSKEGSVELYSSPSRCL